MAGIAKKIDDRFKPGIFDRLKQSKESKEQAKERRLHVVPPPKVERKKKEKKERVAFDVESTRPSPGALLQSQEIHVDPNGYTRVNSIWREWNTMATATTCYDNHTTWDVWHAGTGGSITSAQTVWQGWTTNVHLNRISVIANSVGDTWERWQDTQVFGHANQPPRRPIETPEQIRAREAQEAQYRAQRAAENARYEEERRASENRRKAAEDRAMQLLVSMLNPQQQSDLKNYKYFFVEAPSGRLYRIDYGMHGNVKVVDRVTRKIIERLCIQPSGVMAGDANLMQKLLIETSEEAFRAHANITLENGALVYGAREGLSDERLDNVIPIRRAA